MQPSPFTVIIIVAPILYRWITFLLIPVFFAVYAPRCVETKQLSLCFLLSQQKTEKWFRVRIHREIAAV